MISLHTLVDVDIDLDAEMPPEELECSRHARHGTTVLFSPNKDVVIRDIRTVLPVK